ncbi:MAG: ClbS/DfsB family four-helix bundle protein [Chloroflexota bacterium]
MPRPTTRVELIAEIGKEWQKLQTYLETLKPAQLIESDIVGQWSPKDVLAHLNEWSTMVRSWYTTGQRGEKPSIPAEGYTWRQTPELNQAIYEKHKERELGEIREELVASHQAMLELIASLDDKALFTRAHFHWANNNAMSAYIISATSSHYRWAVKEMRKGFREKNK